MNAAPPERPYVVVNMAMSADGKIATANRTHAALGSDVDQQHLYALRATADAILCGASTVNEPGILLDAGGPRMRQLRIRRGLTPEPLPVVASGRAHLKPSADLFQRGTSSVRPVVLVTLRAPPSAVAALEEAGGEIRAFGDACLDLPAALRWLSQAHAVRRLLVEGGAELNGALLQADLVDEWHVTLCPRLVGGHRAPTVADGTGFPTLAESARLHPPSVRRRGNEVFLVFRSRPRGARGSSSETPL